MNADQKEALENILTDLNTLTNEMMGSEEDLQARKLLRQAAWNIREVLYDAHTAENTPCAKDPCRFCGDDPRFSSCVCRKAT